MSGTSGGIFLTHTVDVSIRSSVAESMDLLIEM